MSSALHTISNGVWSRLQFAQCAHTLDRKERGARCTAYGEAYSFKGNHSLDLRPHRPKPYPIEFIVDTRAPSEDTVVPAPLKASPAPAADFTTVPVPRHLTREPLSQFPKASTSASLKLDLGCGEAVHRDVCAHAGFDWVGVDYQAGCAPILADAPCIPFQDASFEFLLCVTVLQYVQNPFVAMREMFRVLEPGGTLIGSVAFLEPSHGTSFYHPSHVGTHHLLRDAGFVVRHIAPFSDWPALKAMASMGLFFHMPRAMAQAIVAPPQLLHVLWWRLGTLLTRRDLERDRLNHFAGSFSFIASKPG